MFAPACVLAKIDKHGRNSPLLRSGQPLFTTEDKQGGGPGIRFCCRFGDNRD
mgnify:FL=1